MKPAPNNFDLPQSEQDADGGILYQKPARIDFRRIRKALQREVYVADDIKEQILAFFACRFQNREVRQSVALCLMAPPGMGKTALVEALAAALGWQLTKITVGEALGAEGQVLGNRRSDANALAGRIVNALSADPAAARVVLLQDIDKMDPSGIGNTSQGLFEIIRHMEDYALRNNYLSRPLDYTQVIFVATAGNLATVPPGFKDQMDVVRIPSYGDLEKIKIGRNYLIPRLLDYYGLSGRLNLSQNVVPTIVAKYTRDAGIEELEKHLRMICQKVLHRLAESDAGGSIRITTRSLRGYLGPSNNGLQVLRAVDEVGIVNVLGKSERGGYPVVLELMTLAGEGNLVFTGNLDNMLRESAMVAVAYVRYRAAALGVPEDFHKTRDIHIHMLDGTSPKHGVSGGIAIATALVSSLCQKPIRRDLGMTGEISLYGKVLAVKDVREKILGAYRAGLRRVVVPRANRREIDRIPKETLKKMQIHRVDNIKAAIDKAIYRG